MLRRALLSTLVLSVFLGISSRSASASGTACAGQTMAVIKAATGNTPTDGCSQTDLGFNNFSNPTGFGNGAPTPPGASGITLSTTPGTIVGSTISPIGLTFSSTGWSVPPSTTVNVGMQSAFQYTAAPVAGQLPPPGVGNQWWINGLALGMNFNPANQAFAGAPSDIQIKEEFCVGFASFTCSDLGPAYGYILEQANFQSNSTTFSFQVCTPQSGNLSCSLATTGAAAITLAGMGYHDVALNTTLNITSVGLSGITLTLNSFTETFDQIDNPEPSTVILLGTALVGLALFRKKLRPTTL